MKVGVLASGNLGLECLIRCKDEIFPLFIATDISSQGIHYFAKTNNIPLFIGNPRNGKLAAFIGDGSYDIIFSINYLFLIEEDIIAKAKYPINFHGSLLPKYRGRTPHVWAIINNEKKTGVTAHLIDRHCDTGNIVLQREFEIDSKETGADILNKFIYLYPRLIIEVCKLFESRKLMSKPQNNEIATYFGKRIPEDGLIDWNWQKERIYNWVRAQAEPYPGAYALLKGQKVIIDEIKYTNFGFNHNMPNGLILENFPNILVKTPNGVVELNKIRNRDLKCQKGKIFENENR